MPEKKTSWVNGIDSIRFILALIVLLSHLNDPFAGLLKAEHSSVAYIAAVLVNHLFCGAAAVTAFFIISGFVIHYPNRYRTTIDVIPFLVRRWLRVGIPLLVVSAIAAHYHLFGILPLWSLYCELIYYSLYPLIFIVNISWKAKLYWAYTISVVFILLFIADTHHLIFPHSRLFKGDLWYIGIAIISLPCWVLGVLLAARADDLTGQPSLRSLWAYRLLVFSLSTVFVALKMQLHIYYTYSLIIFALLLYKWLEQEVIYHRHHKAVPFMEYLGKFSYSLYLCHMLWFTLIGHFFADNVYTWAAYIMLSIILSYIVYLILEYPSHKLAQKLSARLVAPVDGNVIKKKNQE